MKKRIIRVCSCLLEIAVWYSLGDMGSWCFEIELLKYYEKADFFILPETTCSLEYVDGLICYTTTIYCCCKKCVNFLVFYKNSTSKFLNQIDCYCVRNDMTVFYDGYEQQIYIPREFEIDEENKPYEVDLPCILPEQKSCYTSSTVYTYMDFCGKCRNAFTSFLAEDLIELVAYGE